MSRSRSWLAILLVGAAVIVIWVATKKAAPPEVEFVKVTRETLISSLSTNGKVEPIEWMPVRSERSGVITRVLVSRGQHVTKGQPLVELDTRVAGADLAKAQAAIQEAKAQQQVLNAGRARSRSARRSTRICRERGWIWRRRRRTYQALERLVAKQAATRQELDSARQLVGSTPAENPVARKKQSRARHRQRPGNCQGHGAGGESAADGGAEQSGSQHHSRADGRNGVRLRFEAGLVRQSRRCDRKSRQARSRAGDGLRR